ncbi:MAG: rhodanese-like domain-containing protein, partial [Limnohabitans sp.]
MTRLVELSPAEDDLLAQARQFMSPLLMHDDWLHPDLSQTHPYHPQLYLIYADPANRFSLVSMVFGPGQSMPIHDHTVWGLTGVLRGCQSCQPFSKMSDGRWVPAGFQIDMLPGDIEAVSPRLGDVHKVWNPFPDQDCVCIEVYKGNMGETARHFYREDGSRHVFVQGYANLPSMPMASATPQPPAAPSLPTAETIPQTQTVLTSPDVANTLASPMAMPEYLFKLSTFPEVKQALQDKQEIALIDVREEHVYAQSHPLFAIQLPIGRIEVDAWKRIPRLLTPLVLLDNGEGLAVHAALLFQRIGYSDVRIFQNGLAGWAANGGELFSDVNTPSKAFAECVEAQRKTPSFSVNEVKALIDSSADMVLWDTRRFDEFQSMSILGAVHVPGGELVLHARTLAPRATTRIVVYCDGRIRSILGAQSLINAGIPNPVCVLRNGILGWQLAGFELTTHASNTFGEFSEEDRKKTAASALALLFRAGAKRIEKQE